MLTNNIYFDEICLERYLEVHINVFMYKKFFKKIIKK